MARLKTGVCAKNRKLRFVRKYVLSERKKRGIEKTELGEFYLPEFSCEAFGEGFNLVERQLMHTKEDFGAWQELFNEDVLEIAYQYAFKKQRP